jgi:hypothetical protein
MNRTQRILVEILSPSFLAAAIFTISGCGSDNITDRFVFFPFFLVFAYLYGIVPSVVYAAVMEFWFKKRFHIHKYGLLSTAAVSATLGLGAAFLIQLVIQGTKISSLLPIGTLVGLMVGLYLARRCRTGISLQH